MLPLKRVPIPPEEILKEEFLSPLNLTQEQLAKHLRGTWTQSKLSEIINKKRRITETIALDFADAFGTSSEFWLTIQSRYDLWFAKKSHKRVSLLPQLRKGKPLAPSN